MIRRKLSGVLVGIMISAVSASFAGSENLESFLSRLDAFDVKLKNLSFNYEQIIEYPLTGEEQASSGEAIFEKPKKFYIHQKRPIEQFLISNGKKVWAYTPSFQQVVVTSWQSWTSANLPVYNSLNIVGSLKGLRKQYIILGLRSDQGRGKLEMEFRDGSGTKMDWWMNGEEVIPSEILFRGYNVNVRCRLQGSKLNNQYPDKRFSFKVPEGVSVISAD